MAGQHGGYRKPANPAPVSGPGAHSRRTDGGPAQVMSAAPDQAYGDQTAQMNQQRVAPMGGATPLPQSAQAPSGQPQGHQMPAYQGGDFMGPGDPNEPITNGVDIGPGVGSSALSLPQAPSPAAGTGRMTALLQNLSATDTTGILGQLLQAAQLRNA